MAPRSDLAKVERRRPIIAPEKQTRERTRKWETKSRESNQVEAGTASGSILKRATKSQVAEQRSRVESATMRAAKAILA